MLMCSAVFFFLRGSGCRVLQPNSHSLFSSFDLLVIAINYFRCSGDLHRFFKKPGENVVLNALVQRGPAGLRAAFGFAFIFYTANACLPFLF